MGNNVEVLTTDAVRSVVISSCLLAVELLDDVEISWSFCCVEMLTSLTSLNIPAVLRRTYPKNAARVMGYAEPLVPLCHLDDFRRHFRVHSTIDVFFSLKPTVKLHRVCGTSYVTGRPCLASEKQPLITLWMLSKQEAILLVVLDLQCVRLQCIGHSGVRCAVNRN